MGDECNCGCGRSVKTKGSKYVLGHSPNSGFQKGHKSSPKFHTGKTKRLIGDKNKISMIGNKNANGLPEGYKHSEATKIKLSKAGKGRRHSEETKEKCRLSKIGSNNPSFNNWSSREPYGKEFSPKLKEKIRKAYNYRCQQCFRHQDELKRRLSIHHIDFNKRNNHSENLIPLCDSCHSQTQFGKEDWINYFKQMKVIENG